MQKYSSQPSEKGGYEVIRWNELLNKWESIKGEIYPTEEQSQKRAAELNKEYEEESKNIQ